MESLDISVQHQIHRPNTIVETTLTFFNIVNHALIAFVAIYMTVISLKADVKPMTWHAWSCTIGYQVLMLEGAITFYSENTWSSLCNKETKRYIHWIMQTIGSLLALSGILIEYINYRGKHFDTKHSILGLISGIFLLVSLCNGVSALWSVELRNVFRPVVIKAIHNAVGIVAIVLGLVSLYFGYDKKFMRTNSDVNIRFALQLIVVASVSFSLLGAFKSLCRQLKIIFRNN